MKRLLLFLLITSLTTSAQHSIKKKTLTNVKSGHPYLVGSVKIEGYPIKTQFMDGHCCDETNCPILQHIYEKKSQYNNWTIVKGKKQTKVVDMRLEYTGKVYILTLVGEKYNVFIRTSKSEILALDDNILKFHDGDGKVISVLKI